MAARRPTNCPQESGSAMSISESGKWMIMPQAGSRSGLTARKMTPGLIPEREKELINIGVKAVKRLLAHRFAAADVAKLVVLYAHKIN